MKKTPDANQEAMLQALIDKNAVSLVSDHIVIDTFKTERVVHVVLSDLHFGGYPHSRSQATLYNESRRFASIAYQIGEYKLDHRQDSILVLHVLGDTNEGKLHDREHGAPESEQISATRGYFIQFLAYLSKRWKKIIVIMVPGNHGRNTRRHVERAFSDKWDAIETQIYEAIQDACAKYTNIEFHIRSAFYLVECFDWLMFCTHGDTHFDPGEPYKNINTRRLREQVNELITWQGRDVHVVMAGHVHTPVLIPLNKTYIFINPSLLPPNEYANSRGIYGAISGQWLTEMTQRHRVGDNRLMEIDESVDYNTDLDKIIKHYKYGGLNHAV